MIGGDAYTGGAGAAVDFMGAGGALPMGFDTTANSDVNMSPRQTYNPFPSASGAFGLGDSNGTPTHGTVSGNANMNANPKLNREVVYFFGGGSPIDIKAINACVSMFDPVDEKWERLFTPPM